MIAHGLGQQLCIGKVPLNENTATAGIAVCLEKLSLMTGLGPDSSNASAVVGADITGSHLQQEYYVHLCSDTLMVRLECLVVVTNARLGADNVVNGLKDCAQFRL